MKGLLLINLGSPDSTSISDVKKYLDEFLMDKRVIGKSYIFRWILVKLIILNFRPKKSTTVGILFFNCKFRCTKLQDRL